MQYSDFQANFAGQRRPAARQRISGLQLQWHRDRFHADLPVQPVRARESAAEQFTATAATAELPPVLAQPAISEHLAVVESAGLS